MYLTDFIFAEHTLSELGYMVCSINTSNSEDISMGSVLDFETVKNNGNYKDQIVDVSYQDPITATFDICKSACLTDDDMQIPDNEIRYLMKWLNRRTNQKFKPLYDDYSFPDLFYKGTFTEIRAIQMAGGIIGLTLTFTSDSPFAYQDTQLFDAVGTTNDWSFMYNANTDEIGYMYPEKVVVTCNAAGELKISNALDSVSTIVKNCVAGEIITFDSVHKIITSSKSSHTNLYNDFNYRFPRFVIEGLETENNTFTISLPASIHIELEPVRKVGILA